MHISEALSSMPYGYFFRYSIDAIHRSRTPPMVRPPEVGNFHLSGNNCFDGAVRAYHLAVIVNGIEDLSIINPL